MYLSKLLKFYGNFWGQKSANATLSVPDVCVSCFGGQKLKKVMVLTILSTSAILVGYWNAIVKILRGGGKISCLKNRVFGIKRARCIFGARQIFEVTFGHIQNFCI